MSGRKILPLVTVCVPVWNRIWCIDEFFQSIIKLDYPKEKIAIVFVDNCSTDGTIEKIESFVKNHSTEYHFIRLIVEKTNDPEARNVALKHAVGEFCLFWDTDMMLTEPEKLRRFVAFLQNHSHVGVISGAAQRDLARKSLYEQIVYARTDKFCLGFALFRKSVFEKVGEFVASTPTTCDLELASRLKMRGIGMVCDIEKPFLHVKKETSVARGFNSYLRYLRRAYHDGADRQYDTLLETKDTIHLLRILAYAVFPLIIILSIFSTWLILLLYFSTLLLYQLNHLGFRRIAIIAFLIFFPAGLLQAYGYIFNRIGRKPKVSRKRYSYLDYGGVEDDD